ncbi:MAG: ATP-binding cassette domain-containing protein, partial [Methylobacterium sp.]
AYSAASDGLGHGNATGSDVTATGLTLALPDGRTIVTADSLAMTKGASTLVTGPTGSGKSTLFRAIAGIWPFGKGRIDVPAGQSALVLPQRPYIPLGTLRGAVCYPNTTDQFPDAAIREALVAAQLPALVDRLDEVDAWDQRLSGGEQQRLAIARAVLAKPEWLFLDESTAALDEPSEAGIYQMLRETLPNTTIVSIGHRSTLHEHHQRRVDMQSTGDGRFSPREFRAVAPAE